MGSGKTNEPRCKGCGKKITPEEAERIVRVSIGQLHSVEDGLEDFEEKLGEEVRYFHEICYLLATNDPEAILRIGTQAA
jgi:hypothetical protein